MRQVTWMVLVGVATAWPAWASACGEIDEAEFDLRSYAPVAGQTDVPRDTALRFTVDCALPWGSEAQERFACESGAYPLEVDLTIAGSEERVLGEFVQFGRDRLFVPLEPLRANTTFHVEARLPFRDPKSEGNGVRAASFDFRTGDEMLAKTEVERESRSEFAYYDAPRARCDEGVELAGDRAIEATAVGCPLGRPRGCKIDGTRSIPRLEVTAAALSGPLEPLGTLYVFEVAADRVGAGPSVISVKHRHVAQGEEAVFTWDLTEELGDDATGRVCTTLRAIDGAGRSQTVHDACFELDEARAQLGPNPEAGDGCSVQRRARGLGSLSVFGLFVALVIRRRKRSV